MANVAKPTGFKPVRMKGGAVYDGAVTHHPIAYNYGTAMYVGDAVKLVSGKINLAGVTDQIAGIIVGFEMPALSTYGTMPAYWPAGGFATLGNQDCYALVVSDPNVVFEAQFASTTVPTLADINKYCKVTTSTAGSTSTGISGQAVDASTLNTSVSGLVWRFVGFVERPSNDITTAYARGLFVAANHVGAATVAAA